MGCFKVSNPGNGCECGGTLNVTVRKCASAAAVGETVTVTLGGVAVATGVTNGSGVASLTVPAGTVSVTTTAPANYDPGSGSATVTSGGTTALTITLAPSAGYSCSPTPCYPGISGPPYADPVYPSTMYVHDGVALVTVSRVGTSLVWTGTATRTAAQALPVPYTRTACVAPAPLTSTSVPVVFVLQCQGTGTFGPWYVAAECYDVVDNTAGCPFVACAQNGGGAITSGEYAPAAASTGCVGASASANMSGGQSFTPTTNFPAFAGSATAFLNVGVKVAPYQIYGASVTFTVSQ